MENKNINQQQPQKNTNTDVANQGSKSAPSSTQQTTNTGMSGGTYGSTTGSKGNLSDKANNVNDRKV
jgi:hypothetical protein